MEFPLNEFEQHIDEKILQRGLNYWKKELVDEIIEEENSVFQTTVHGSEDYEVQVNIENGIVKEYFCDCPYDLGPICKHITAVLFALQEDQFEELKEKKKPLNKSKKPKENKLDEILKEAPKEVLLAFILDYSRNDKQFKNLINAKFSLNAGDKTKDSYKNFIRKSLDSARDKYGYIQYGAANYALIPIDDLLDECQRNIDTGPYEKIITICQAVIEELMPAIEKSDDSDGEISGTMDNAFNTLQILIDEKADFLNKPELFNYFIGEALKEKYKGWGWQWNLIDLAVEMLENESQEKRLYELLGKLPSDSRYDAEKIAEIKLRIIELNHSGDEAEKFLEQNIKYSSFRRKALEKAFNKSDYEKVKKIAMDGIEYDKQLRGLVHDWYDWLLKAATAENNKPDIINYAKLLFREYKEMEYFKILKDNVPSEKWNDTVEEFVTFLNKDCRSPDYTSIASIYIEERRYRDLLVVLQNHPGFYNIEKYEGYLKADYKIELLDIYEKSIKTYLINNIGRNHYQSACRMLRRMNKFGDIERTKKIISELIVLYKKRPALLEELRMV